MAALLNLKDVWMTAVKACGSWPSLFSRANGRALERNLYFGIFY